MTSYKPVSRHHDDETYLESQRERERQRALALAASVGTLMVAIRRGGLSGLALGAFSGLLAYRASTGRGLKGTGRSIARSVERTLVGHRTGPIDLSASVTVQRSPEELYAFWRDFTRLPQIMTSIKAVEKLPDGRTHWQAETAMGDVYEWDAEIVEDVPGEHIRWRAVENADVLQIGDIRFLPGPGSRNTQVELSMRYRLPHGLLSAAPRAFVNALSREALREDLDHFRQVMEAGEMPTGAVPATDHDGGRR